MRHSRGRSHGQGTAKRATLARPPAGSGRSPSPMAAIAEPRKHAESVVKVFCHAGLIPTKELKVATPTEEARRRSQMKEWGRCGVGVG